VIFIPGPRPLEGCALGLAALVSSVPGELYRQLDTDAACTGRAAGPLARQPTATNVSAS
jgi:hypothetical protein